jgi:hypothetical protein
LYKHFEALALDIRGSSATHDASEPHLRAVWEAVLSGKVSPFPGAEPSQWERSDLSIFHMGYDTIEGHSFPVLRGSDEYSLESVINLKEIIEREGPFRHTFIVGAQEHWTTLVYEKDSDQNVTWYGLNSRRDIQEEFLRNIPVLESAMKAFEETAFKEYLSSTGKDLDNRASLLMNNNGAFELINEQNIEIFFDLDTLEPKYLPKLLIATQFMYRMGWLRTDAPENGIHETDIFNIRALLEFYRNTHSEDSQFREIEQLLP